MNPLVQYGFKIVVSALILVTASELSKRNPLLGSLLVSLPMTSILTLLWLYHDTQDVRLVSEVSFNIFWLVIASLVFFVALPFLLKKQMPFYGALLLSMASTALVYSLAVYLMRFLGRRL